MTMKNHGESWPVGENSFPVYREKKCLGYLWKKKTTTKNKKPVLIPNDSKSHSESKESLPIWKCLCLSRQSEPSVILIDCADPCVYFPSYHKHKKTAITYCALYSVHKIQSKIPSKAQSTFVDFINGAEWLPLLSSKRRCGLEGDFGGI